MTCETARILLLFYRPGRTTDLAAEDVAALESHLVGCPACSALVARQAAADAAIGGAFRQINVPGGLKDRLQTHAAAEAGRLWRRTWATRTAAAAAAILVGLLGWGWYIAATRPELDTLQLAAANEYAATYPDRAGPEFLAAQGIPGPLPEDFDFQRLTSYGFASVQGEAVPVLEFRAGENSFARVYFLRPGQFGVNGAIETQNSTVTVRLYRNRPAGGWTTVVVHTGNGLQPFLKVSGPET
jgi:hypothetical protein